MIKDAYGQELNLNDLILSAVKLDGRYTTLCLGKVVKICPKSVKAIFVTTKGNPLETYFGNNAKSKVVISENTVRLNNIEDIPEKVLTNLNKSIMGSFNEK